MAESEWEPPPGLATSGQPANEYGKAALGLGIASIVLNLLTAIPAIALGVLGLARVRRGEATNPGQARAGIVVSAAVLVVTVVVGAVLVGHRSAKHPVAADVLASSVASTLTRSQVFISDVACPSVADARANTMVICRGNVDRLPYRVLVTFTDSDGNYQLNSPRR